jgi:hypothetical protein
LLAVGHGDLVRVGIRCEFLSHAAHLQRLHRLAGEPGYQRGDFLNRQHVVYRHVVDSAAGHASIAGGFRVLYDGQTTPLLDSQQAGGAVVQVTRENDANNTAAEAESGRAEERV